MKNDQIKDRSMLNEIVQPLTDWYRQNKRILPWRDQNNAYYTWVSEIMLQQTRVEAVKPYFQRFIGELPDVQALPEQLRQRLQRKPVLHRLHISYRSVMIRYLRQSEPVHLIILLQWMAQGLLNV